MQALGITASRSGTAIAEHYAMIKLRPFASVALALGSAVLVAGCSDSTATVDATLRVNNQSDFSIVELHLTQVGNSSWGPDRLNGRALIPGDSITLGVSCDTYAALLVDDTGVDCQIDSIDLCLNDADWVIHNNTCTVFGAAKAAREAESAQAQAGAATAPDATR